MSTFFYQGISTPVEPLYYERDYTADFELIKDLSTDEIVDRICDFLPHWINSNEGTNTKKLLYSLVDHQKERIAGNVTDYSGIKYLYELLRQLIKDCYIGSAQGYRLYELGLDLTNIYPREGEHDWHFRYRIIEMLYEMKATRNNLDRLVVKWLGTYTVNFTGENCYLYSTMYRYEFPPTYEYYVRGGTFKGINIYINGIPLIKNINYNEIGKINRLSTIIDFFDSYTIDDIIEFEFPLSNYKTLQITGDELIEINRYRFTLPQYYHIREDNYYNLKVYKNNQMLRPFEDYNEFGNEQTYSRAVDIWSEPDPSDDFKFEIMGHAHTDGYHMVTTHHHILEQKDYGFYGGSAIICESDYELEINQLVNFDETEKLAVIANPNDPILANGIVNEIIQDEISTKYVIKTQGYYKNRKRNSDRTFEWDFTPGATLYLDTNGGITETSTIQEIGTAITGNTIKLSVLFPEKYGSDTFYNSPTGKFNRPATIYIVVKNAVQHGANFRNYNPKTGYYNSYSSFFVGSELNPKFPMSGFYGIGPETEYRGMYEDSNLYNLMKEVLWCKPIGVKIIFELHPQHLKYDNRYINDIS